MDMKVVDLKWCGAKTPLQPQQLNGETCHSESVRSFDSIGTETIGPASMQCCMNLT